MSRPRNMLHINAEYDEYDRAHTHFKRWEKGMRKEGLL